MFKPILLWLCLMGSLFAQAMPDPWLTPGAVISGVPIETLLQRGFASSERHVSKAEKARIFAHYGIADHRGFVIDHLIPLEIGGSNIEQNLWPQPAAEARRKDRLENRMSAQLRATYKSQGREAAALQLLQFQKEIASDWLTAVNR